MTKEFIRRCGFLDEYAAAGTYESLDVVESAVEALSEGVSDKRVVSTMLSYTHKSFYEILDNIKESLIKLCRKVLSSLNNYYINNVKLYQRYQEIIKKGLRRMTEPIIHDTYEYPRVKSYPHEIGSGMVERDIIAIHRKMTDPSYDSSGTDVDRLLVKFSREVLDAAVDPFKLKDSTKTIVEKKLQGRHITMTVTVDTIDEIFKTLSDYHTDRAAIKDTEKAILADYDKFRRTYKKVTEEPMKLIGEDRTLKRLADPEKEDMIAREYNRYADIHVDMMRLFNGYVTMYSEAFKTKLRILDDKYMDYRNLLIELFTKTGTMAAMGRAKPSSSATVIDYNPKVGSFKT